MTNLVADLTQTGAISVPPFFFCLLNKTFTVIGYFKLIISSSKSLKKSSMLDLLALIELKDGCCLQ